MGELGHCVNCMIIGAIIMGLFVGYFNEPYFAKCEAYMEKSEPD